MKLLKQISYTLILVVALASCKKDAEVNPNNSASNGSASEPECPSGGVTGQSIKGHYIVFLKEGSVSAKLADPSTRPFEYLKQKSLELMSKNGLKGSPQQVYSGVTKGFSLTASKDKIEALRKDVEVASIAEDKVIGLSPSIAEASSSSDKQIIPWGVKRVGYGSPTSKTAWILDTGIDQDHPDLNVDASRSRSFVCAESSLDDENGHGTHVAGIIGAKNNDVGVVGVAPGNTLVSVKVMAADGKGSVSSLLAGLEYIYNNAHSGDVINLSLSGGTSETLDQYVAKLANDKHVYLVVAAGNESQSANDISPQRVINPQVFTVSAMDNTDTFASFSNYGSCVDYCAPGVKITSTYMGGKYATLSGTSMAAPHLAGLLLLNGANVKKDGTVKNDPDGTPDPIPHI